MDPVTLAQRDSTTTARRTQYGLYVVLFPLVTFMGALPFAMTGTSKPVAWLAGAAIALGVCALVWLLRRRQLGTAAASGSLTLDATGLTAHYGGTRRHLACADIERVGPLPYPESRVGAGGSPAGLVVSAGINAAHGLAAPKPPGAVGAGEWPETPSATLQGVKLRREFQISNGRDPSAPRPLVPIWFPDYEEDWRAGAIGAAVRAHRPDLLVD